MAINKKIGIIGGGNMGEAIFSRLSNVMEKSVSLMISESDTARKDYLETKYKIIVEIDNNLLVKYSDVIIIAVKPKDFEGILKDEICCGVSEEKLVISIAAGITTKYIENIAGKDVPVIRVMPNMAAVIGEGISAICRGSSASTEDMKLAKEIFSMIGDVIEVEEGLMDAVTAVSGSGPAYYFYLTECLVEAGRELGLDESVAKKLVLKTALGSAKLSEASKDDPAVLRAKVASKGGTTEAAFKVFESKGFKDIIKTAVKKACERSKEMSKG